MKLSKGRNAKRNYCKRIMLTKNKHLKVNIEKEIKI